MSFKKHILSLGVGISVLLFSTPCFATVVMEGAPQQRNDSYNNIQVIEGNQIVEAPSAQNIPPVPAYPPVYVGTVPSTPQPQVYVGSVPSTPQTPQRFMYAPSDNIASVIASMNRSLAPMQVNQMAETIHYLSSTYSLDPRLLASLIAVESSFRPTAISSSGAVGLGQLKPDTARWLGVANPFDPIQNLMGAAKYLRYLLNRYNGNVVEALAAYSRGQGTIERYGIDQNALAYVRRVNTIFTRFF
jgi:Transglycosylase SLT domain